MIAFACFFPLWYNLPDFELVPRDTHGKADNEETGMLLEDLKQQLDSVKGRLETLRRHL